MISRGTTGFMDSGDELLPTPRRSIAWGCIESYLRDEGMLSKSVACSSID